jgi:exodeoxyribonuclease VIII
MNVVKDSNDQYHSHTSISASGLKYISKHSVLHFIHQIRKETESMAFGTAVHTALLESDTFYDIYYPLPEIGDLRKKENKELKKHEESKSEGKICLSFKDHEKIKEMLKNYKKNTLAQHYCKGEVELSHYLKYENVDVRVRPDVINHLAGFIADVKTCQDASPQAFRRDIYKFKYHLQAAFYMDMLEIDTFKFICVEVNHPYTVVVHTLDQDFIELGRDEWKKAFKDWKHYLETNEITLYQPETSFSTIDKDGSYLIKK